MASVGCSEMFSDEHVAQMAAAVSTLDFRSHTIGIR